MTVVLDIVRYCIICGQSEFAHTYPHEFEPDIPWDYAGGVDLAETFRRNPGKPGMVADYFLRGPSTGRLDCSKPNQVNAGRAETAWTRLCAAEDAEDDDE
jgi:hypothetical protein